MNRLFIFAVARLIQSAKADRAVYTIQAGNTCMANGSPAPSPTPDDPNSNCGEHYLVETGEDCGSFTTQFEIALDDFLLPNSQDSINCTDAMRDQYYCECPVGYTKAYPGYGASARTEPSQGVIPIANGTPLDCYEYMAFRNTTDNDAADCWNLAGILEITPEEFVSWNPSLGENKTSVSPPRTTTLNGRLLTITPNPYAYPCTLAESTSYCIALTSPTETSSGRVIATPAPRATGEVANCTVWFPISSERDTCQSILYLYRLAFEQFFAMNPSVKDDCSGLVIGTYYCISTYPEGAPGGQPGWTGPKFSRKTATMTTTESCGSDTSTTSTTSLGPLTPSPM